MSTLFLYPVYTIKAYEHLCHLQVNIFCAFHLDKILYFWVREKKTRHFEISDLNFTSRFQLSLEDSPVWASLPSPFMPFYEIDGSSSIGATETIFRFHNARMVEFTCMKPFPVRKTSLKRIKSIAKLFSKDIMLFQFLIHF